MNSYVETFKKYAVFIGRARRKEYWTFALINAVIGFVLASAELRSGVGFSDYSPLTSLFSLVVFLPSLGVSIRRLHDTGRTGWWMLLGFIPFLGAIVLLVFFAQDSQAGDNEHGPNPKAIVAS